MSASFLASPIFADYAGRTGSPSANRKVYFYETGASSVKLPVYRKSKTVGVDSPRQANPVVLGANGRPVTGGAVWLDPELVYRIVVTEADGSVVYLEDAIPGANVGISSEVTQPRLTLTEETAPTPTSTNHALQIGTRQNLRMGRNAIQATSDGGPRSLGLNEGGGDVILSRTLPNETITYSNRNARNMLDAGGSATPELLLNGQSITTRGVQQGVFVSQILGGNTLPFFTLRWTIFGGQTYLSIPEIIEPEASSPFFRTQFNLPVDLRPFDDQTIAPVVGIVEGEERQARVQVSGAGASGFGRLNFLLYSPVDDNFADNWPVSGSKGVRACTISYKTDAPMA